MVRLLFSSNDTLLRCKSKDGRRGLQGFNGGDDLKCEFAFDNFSALFSSIRNDYLAQWVTPQPWWILNKTAISRNVKNASAAFR